MAFDERTRLLIGDEAVDRLKAAHVIVFGVGGVGGYTAEAWLWPVLVLVS